VVGGGASVKAEVKTVVQTSEKSGSVVRELLPNEGKVGVHNELKRLEKRGDNLTPHHFPQASYMEKYGVNPKDGISIMMEQHTPGIGGMHRSTRTYGRAPDFSTAPREELYLDIVDIRGLYKKDGLYTPEIRANLQEGIQKWKELRPDLFLKK
jgi:filamentous hemagglutinin